MKIVIETDSRGGMTVMSDGENGGVNGLELIQTLLTVAVDAAKRFGSNKQETIEGLKKSVEFVANQYFKKEMN